MTRGAEQRSPEIDLRIGDIRLPPPPAALHAVAALSTAPAPLVAPAGLTTTREHLSRHFTRHIWHATPDQVVVCSGATSAAAALITAWTRPGDTVLVPDPGFPGHRHAVEALGRSPLVYPVPDPSGDWLMRLESLAAEAQALIWLSPNNPTGEVPLEADCRAVADIAAHRGLFLISDEVHHDLVWAGTHASPLPFAQPDRRAAVWSASKSLRLAGWRVGCAVSPPKSAQRIARTVGALTVAASLPAQVACNAAVGDYGAVLRQSRDNVLPNLQYAVDVLHPLVVMPRSGVCLWVDIGVTKLSSKEFALLCREQAGLRVWPGDRFGPAGARHVRICLGLPQDMAQRAVHRLAELLRPYT